ncbi:hypothetical protein EDC01DRAFT_761674 [Geopyxis carbonaria]|nr:hypothetical protein EDC01DRAFT_761674 [Geopyxis carbonaria]
MLFRTTVLLLFSVAATALGPNKLVSFSSGRNGLQLSGGAIKVSGDDYPGVIRVANDLSDDFEKVTGRALSVDSTNSTSASSKTVIIAGTVGNSKLIDTLVSTGKINVSEIKGKWESYATQIVRNPMRGVSKALVIAGSDKRGTIFGLYAISEEIGVSPWYWWADVAVQKHSAVYALDKKVTQGPPSVKYRGIFLNDEQPALTGWVREKYDGKYGHEFYIQVFELLLRLKANFLWPTMWDSMFGVDDLLNQKLADEYGIVMSTSHTEPLQMSTKEWNEHGEGNWDYTSNSDAIKSYWEKGIERAKDYEGVWTVGMRGNGDNVLSEDVVTELLQKVVADQRTILSDILEKNATDIPQVWCLYKDIQAYYEEGMRVPEDVTLLWTDDNWGNVRRLPTANESNPAGMYYHFDYVGDPRDYKWINTISLEKTWEQLAMTYERNAREIWVVNVGDLKPLELPIDYFMNLAYDFNTWGKPNQVLNYHVAWATREFGATHAREIADIMDLYGFYAARRKFELLDPATYSVIHYSEAATVLKQWANLTTRADAVYSALPTASKAAFFELVLHPITAGYIVHDIHISAALNNLYARQRRTSTNDLADHVLTRFKDDAALTVRYNKLLNGKWSHMMDQTHLGYNYWQQSMRNTLPPLSWVQSTEASLAGHMGVAVESSNGSVPGDDYYNAASYGNNTLVLPPLDPYAPVPYRTLEVFSKGTEPFTFTISPHNPWIKVSPSAGTVSPGDKDVSVKVSVDWASAPTGVSIAFLNITSTAIYGDFGAPQVNLPVNNTVVPASFSGFVESNRILSLPASKAKNAKNKAFQTIPRLGRAVETSVTLATNATDAPALEFPVYAFTSTSNATITLQLGAALNFDPHAPLRYAVQFGDGAKQEVKYVPALKTPLSMPAGWEAAVAGGNVWISKTTHTVAKGAGTVKVWILETGVVLQRVIVELAPVERGSGMGGQWRGVQDSYLGPPESVWVN